VATSIEIELIKAGTALARSIGHDPHNNGGPVHGCPKASPMIPCTCGAGQQQAKALDDWQHLMVDIEEAGPVDVRNMSSFSDNKLDT